METLEELEAAVAICERANVRPPFGLMVRYVYAKGKFLGALPVVVTNDTVRVNLRPNWCDKPENGEA